MLAVTIDGHIAREDGSFDFLDPYSECFTGWDEFIASIDSIVMGRRTFEQAIAMDRWLYKDKRIRVLTRRPIDGAPDNVDSFTTRRPSSNRSGAAQPATSGTRAAVTPSNRLSALV